METMDAEAVFIDTQILIYAASIPSPLYARAKDKLAELEHTGLMLCISRQVLREFLAVLTRPEAWVNPVPVDHLTDQARQIEERFTVLEESPGVTTQLYNLLVTTQTRGKQVHDANIVAVMLTHGVKHLLTHNARDFHRFEPLIRILPFVT